MIDLLNVDLIQEVMSLLVESVAAGVAISCIASALSCVITMAFRLVHKMI